MNLLGLFLSLTKENAIKKCVFKNTRFFFVLVLLCFTKCLHKKLVSHMSFSWADISKEDFLQTSLVLGFASPCDIHF